MVRKRAGQRTFSDAILFGAHIPDPNTTAADQAGKISVGIKTKRTEDYWYSTLMDEAHHSYNQGSGVCRTGGTGSARPTDAALTRAAQRAVSSTRWLTVAFSLALDVAAAQRRA